MDREIACFAKVLQFAGQGGEGSVAPGQVRHHDHAEHILQDGLGHFYNIHLVFGTDGRHLGKNAHGIFTYNCNDCSHYQDLRFVYYLLMIITKM